MGKKALRGTRIIWCGIDLGEVFENKWPLSDDDKTIEYLKQHDKDYNEELQKGASLASIGYFWNYEDYIRQQFADGFEKKEEAFINYCYPGPLYYDDDPPDEYKFHGLPGWESASIKISKGGKLLPEQKNLIHPTVFDTYESYLKNHIRAINSLHTLYSTCMRKNYYDPNDRIIYLFDILAAAEDCERHYWQTEWDSAKCIPEDYRFDAIYNTLRGGGSCFSCYELASLSSVYFPKKHFDVTPNAIRGDEDYDKYYKAEKISRGFPLLSSYKAFQETAKDRYSSYVTRTTFNNPKKVFDHPYWYNYKCHKELIRDFSDFCIGRKDKNIEYLSNDKEIEYGKHCLLFLDSILNKMFNSPDSIWLEYASDTQELNLLFGSLPSALYGLLICDLQSSNYATCQICHCEFKVPDRRIRKFCPDHVDKQRSHQAQIKKQFERK